MNLPDPNPSLRPKTATRLRRQLLNWYGKNARVLPWRVPPGGPSADPYRVWLSEIMLQQTTVATVGPYFEKFVRLWPDVAALACAERDQVMTAWAGLGYYTRARNLHKCAQHVAGELGGTFPNTEDALIKLPGIGPYTAAAIAAIAFGRSACVVDGNVDRVMVRLFALKKPIKEIKSQIYDLAEVLTPNARAGDYAQGVMDLGATVCTPKNPKCNICPWADDCQALAKGIAADLPVKPKRPPKPTRHGTAFWITRSDGAVLLRRRGDKGLLGGMMEVPCSEWRVAAPGSVATPGVNSSLLAQAPVQAKFKPVPGLVTHTFTHFHLELKVVAGTVDGRAKGVGSNSHLWTQPKDIAHIGLPTVMMKIARLVMGAE